MNGGTLTPVDFPTATSTQAIGVNDAGQIVGNFFDAASVEHGLFDAFFSTKPDGLGMGLRVSRSISEAHGGRISATSTSLNGATFQLFLPADTEGCKTRLPTERSKTALPMR